MDVNKILDELRLERDQLDEAILSLERLAIGARRRGRPPLWIQAAQQRTGVEPEQAAAASPKKRKKRKVKAVTAAAGQQVQS